MLDVGSIVCYLRLQDEMSPKLLEVSGNLQRTVTIGAALGTVLANAAMSAGSSLIEMGQEAILTAARTESLAAVAEFLGQRAGYTTQYVRDLTAELNAQGITMQESSNVIVQLARANIDLENATALATAAQNAAFISGMNSSEALSAILHGIITLQPEVIRTAGITINLQQAYADFSKQTGQTVESLTGQQKQQIALNAVLQEAERINGTYALSMEFVGKQLTSLPRYYEDASGAIGTLFLPLLRLVVSGLTEFLQVAREHPTTITMLSGLVLGLGGAASIAGGGILAMTVGWSALGAALVVGAGLILNVVDQTRAMAMGYTDATMAEEAWASANNRTVESLSATEKQSIQTATRLELVLAVMQELVARWIQLDFWRNSYTAFEDLPEVSAPSLALPEGLLDPGGLALWEEQLKRNAEATRAAAEAMRAADEAAAKWRQTLNWLGEEYMALDLAAYNSEQQVQMLSTSYQVATASVGGAVEQYAFLRDRITELPLPSTTVSIVDMASAWSKVGTELVYANGPLGSTILNLNLTAYASNNASQELAKTTQETYKLSEGYLTLGRVVLDLQNVTADVADGFGAIADASGAAWADMLAQGASFANDMIAIWTNPETGVVDKVINSAIRLVEKFGDALNDSGGEKTMRDVGRDWGVAITEEMGDAIFETAKTLFGGDRTAAQLFHLGDLLDAAGGLNAVNFDTFVGKLRDVFVMLDTGMFDSAQAITVLSENWAEFVEVGIDASGRLKPELVELMDLTSRFAREMASPELAQQFVDQWLELVEQLDLRIRENFELTANGLSEIFGMVREGLLPPLEAVDAWLTFFDQLDLGIRDHFDTAIGGLFDIFGLVEQGLLTAQQAADALDETWDTFVTEGTDKVTGLLDPALQAAIVSMRQLGIESDAVTSYIRDQLSTVVEGLNERVGVFGDVVTSSLEDGVSTTERLGLVLKTLGTDAAGLQQEFDRLGTFTLATFGALISEGYGLRDALDLIGESLDTLALADNVDQLGLSASNTLQQLLDWREIVKENEGVFASIDGLQKMMVGLANTGYMTQEVFSAFGTDLFTQFDRLVDRGVDANDAMLLMQPSLQTLWELQHRFGFEVDETTQGLLDQAESAGLIGGAFQEPLEQIRDILLGIAKALGAELPDYFDTLGQTAGDTFAEVEKEWAIAWQEMQRTAAESIGVVEGEIAGLTAPDLQTLFDTGEIYQPGYVENPFVGPQIDWLKVAQPRGGGGFGMFTPTYNPDGSLSYKGGAGATIPTGPGTMGGTGKGGCGIYIGTVVVADGTAPSVGKMFLRSLKDEIERGGDSMDDFRRLMCEAAKC
jgi:hypothetical protein